MNGAPLGSADLAAPERAPPAAQRRFYDAENAAWMVKVFPGEYYLTPRSDELRALITFRRLNLLEPWPFAGQFDAIFCRNVMIYFDAATKSALVERFTQQIKPGGWLYIGHSESLIGPHPGLKSIGRTVYRRET